MNQAIKLCDMLDEEIEAGIYGDRVARRLTQTSAALRVAVEALEIMQYLEVTCVYTASGIKGNPSKMIPAQAALDKINALCKTGEK